LINSRLPLVTAAPLGSGRGARHLPGAHLLPKLRCQFAEFLNHGSLMRLGILYLSTCVGLRYGHCPHSLRGFSGEPGLNHFARAEARARLRLSALVAGRICQPHPPTGLNRAIHNPADLPFSVPPSLLTCAQWCRNINRLAIAYASRLPLRHRLTLSRLPLPRNPQTCGDEGSRLVSRYSCLHKRFSGLQASSRWPFTGKENAPLPSQTGTEREDRDCSLSLSPLSICLPQLRRRA
jgi:hypothetical protein